MKEIESFADVSSEMHTSLKPRIPRFQKELSTGPVARREFDTVKKDASHVVESPQQTKVDSLVSPSSLVSWQAGCTTEGGRQLTHPFAKSKSIFSEVSGESESVLEKTTSSPMVQPPVIFDVVGETNDDLLEGIVVKQTPRKVYDGILGSICSSPENLVGRDGSMLLMTPRLKFSPPNTCVLLEPVPEFKQTFSRGMVHQSTPYPNRVGISEGPQHSESSSRRSSEKMSMKDTELLGIKLGNIYGNRRTVVEESPYRMMSPPKTCVFMEPPDDNLLINAPSDYPFLEACFALDHGANLLSMKENDHQDVHSLVNKTCKQGA